VHGPLDNFSRVCWSGLKHHRVVHLWKGAKNCQQPALLDNTSSRPFTHPRHCRIVVRAFSSNRQRSYPFTASLSAVIDSDRQKMSSGLQRRRVAGGGDNSTSLSPSSSRPDLANQNSFSGRNSPAVNHRNEGINAIDQQDSDHRIAFDPRDMEEGQEREKFPKLTMMEEVLLLGLKDKQVLCVFGTMLIQGYLSFWNDNISYTLRGCILLELAFRSRISMQKDSSRRRFELADRLIEVIDDRLTGEVLLDEALKMMKASEKMSVGSWIDLMSGTQFHHKHN